MPSLSPLTPSAPCHTYHINPVYRSEISIAIGLLIACSLIGLIVYCIGWIPPTLSGIFIHSPIVLLAIAVIGYCVCAARRYMRETWLVLTPTIIVYHAPGIVIETRWENVQALQLRMRKAELVLKEPSSTFQSIGTTFAQATSSAGRDIDKRIPLYAFTIWTPQSHVYQDISEFAPHLLRASTPRGEA